MLKSNIEYKLQSLAERYIELGSLLSDSVVIQDNKKFRDYSKEYADLTDIVNAFNEYQIIKDNLLDAENLSTDADPEMRALGQEEVLILRKNLDELSEKLKRLLLPKDPDDEANVYLEIRAGTGGDEAAIFVGDLCRMYLRFSEIKNWQAEIINSSSAPQGGYKEVILRIAGRSVYHDLKFESGAHRVQRVPVTEAQGRIHTSACTVAVLPEIEEINQINIEPKDLRIDTFRASGAGGQHVNRTDSAVRITHIPTGTVVECQDDRSQHKNKAKAMSVLQAKILAQAKATQQQEQASVRKSLVGSGDRSERIRTYNYPQGRVTDHRINLTLYKLPEIMEGDLGEVIEGLQREDQLEKLGQLEE